MKENVSEIKNYYIEIFRSLQPTVEPPKIHIEFYNYVGINHTIRIRNGEIFVRICEICRDAPPEVQKSLAFILIAKLLRKRVSKQARFIYEQYVKSAEIQEAARSNRKTKGRKIVSSPIGKVYNLDLMFDEINEVYFENEIPKPVLTWSNTKTFRILGHHDPTHNTIVISQTLDNRSVPNYVVQAVMHHEMLHIKHPTKKINGRRYSHTPAFRRDEREFDFYEQSERWIREHFGQMTKKKSKNFFRRLFDL
jgi:hypothetical protein